MLLKEHLHSLFGSQKDLPYFAWVQTLEAKVGTSTHLNNQYKVEELSQCLDDIRTCDRGWKKNSLDQLSNLLDEVPLDKPIERNVSSSLIQHARSALLSMWYHLLHVLGNGDEIDEYSRHSAIVLSACHKYEPPFSFSHVPRIIIRPEFDPKYLGSLSSKDEVTFRITANPEVITSFRQYIDLLHRLHAFIAEYLMANIPLACDIPVRLLVCLCTLQQQKNCSRNE